LEERDLFIVKLTQQPLNNSFKEMHYTGQLTKVHLMMSLKVSLMLMLIKKPKIMKEKLQLILHVKQDIQLQLYLLNSLLLQLNQQI
jgi:hypothetical protein